MKQLLAEYRHALREVNQARARAIQDGRADDASILSSCATGISYVIDWIGHGREPGNKRAITRYAGYQREIPMDPGNIEFIKQAVLSPTWGKQRQEELTTDQLELLEDLLAKLTVKERDAFVLVRGRGYSYSEAAELMHVKKTSIQNMVERAEKKLYFVVRKPPIGEGNICYWGLEKLAHRQ